MRHRSTLRSEQDNRASGELGAIQHRYAVRAGVEGTIGQAVDIGVRRSRYLGLAKTHLAHILTAAAINLIRIDAWWTGAPQGHTRTSHLAALDFALAG